MHSEILWMREEVSGYVTSPSVRTTQQISLGILGIQLNQCETVPYFIQLSLDIGISRHQIVC